MTEFKSKEHPEMFLKEDIETNVLCDDHPTKERGETQEQKARWCNSK